VKQAIEKIMDFVTITVHPKNTVTLDLSENGLTVLSDSASIDIESIKKHLVVILFNHQKQSEVESLVQNYQSLIIKLLNDLFSYQNNSGQNKNLNSLYRLLCDLLVNVLTYIETYFSKYFDLDQGIPHIYYLLNNKEFQQQLNKLKIKFKDRSADLKLTAIITSHFTIRGQGQDKKTITFRDLIYRKELVGELVAIGSSKSSYKTVEEVLQYMNYNHIEFFKLFIDKLQEEYNKLETLDAKLEILKYQGKLFRQMYVKPNVALFSQFPSIKDQVLNWIEEEIIFMEGQIKQLEQVPLKKEIEPLSSSKISVALSVAQLAFLIRVLTLGKIITNSNQSDVIRIFATSFKTFKTEDISYGSLYGKYFKPEPAAIKEVKGVLLQLVGLITRMKE
jgi:hypothetical protein